MKGMKQCTLFIIFFFLWQPLSGEIGEIGRNTIRPFYILLLLTSLRISYYMIIHYGSTKKRYFGESILFGHSIINLMIMVIVYPSTIFIFLGNFPRIWWKQALWVGLWVFLYSSIEYVNLYFLDLINHYHGWNMGWSIAFNIVMFSILRIHHKNPPIAWIASMSWIIFLWYMFDVPTKTLP